MGPVAIEVVVLWATLEAIDAIFTSERPKKKNLSGRKKEVSIMGCTNPTIRTVPFIQISYGVSKQITLEVPPLSLSFKTLTCSLSSKAKIVNASMCPFLYSVFSF